MSRRPKLICGKNWPLNTGLPAGCVVVPEEDVLADHTDAARLLQEALTRTGIFEPVLGANTSLQSPWSEDKQPKRRRSSMDGEKNKRAKTDAPESSPVEMTTGPPSGPVIDIVKIDDDERLVMRELLFIEDNDPHHLNKMLDLLG
nr:uncharacterized protein LOC108944154 [Nicotiana tomentosiformis]